MSRFAGKSLAVAALLAGGALSTQAHAQAFYLQEQSSRAAGRAFSGEVADTGVESLWWNPAAIADIEGGEVVLNASAILPKGDVVDTGTLIARPGQSYAAVGGDSVSSDPIDKGVVPSGAVAYRLGRGVVAGVAVTSPFSFTTDYDDTSWARYSAQRTKLRTIDIQPSLAIAPTDWLRVGVAANVEYSDAELGNSLPNVLATLPDGQQVLSGDGWDLGWSAGFQMHNDFATVGMSYKSAIEHTLTGSLEISGLVGPLEASNTTIDDVEASFYTPSQFIVGGRFRLADPLTLNTQYVRYGWSKFDAISLGAPVNSALPQNYEDSWSLAGGLDYAVSPALTVRTGVQFATTPTQDGERDARVPDSDRWNYGVGATYQMTPKFGINLAANYVDFEDATIDRVTAAYAGTAAQTVIVTNGELQNAHAVVLSAGTKLAF